ncbi:hypothetical protein Esti_004832 [Eimeria stiedai]
MTYSMKSKAGGLFPTRTHSHDALGRCRFLRRRLILFLSVIWVLLSAPVFCATAGRESNASAEEKRNGAAEHVVPLTLTLVPAPDLGLAVGETRDEHDKLVNAYPFLLSTDQVTESFKALVRSEEEARLDLLVKEGPAWLLFYFRELAITQFVLKNVSDPQYGGLENELKTAELLKGAEKAESCESHRCKVTPLQTASCVGEDLSHLSPATLEKIFAARLHQFLAVKQKLEAGDASIGYYDVLQWTACPHMSHAFMNGYVELAGELGSGLTEGGTSSRGRTLVKKWLAEPAVQNNFEALIRDRRTWVTSSPITGAVWILKAAAAQSLLGIKTKKSRKEAPFGLLGLCTKACRRPNPDRLERPQYKRLGDVLRLFIFHHQQLTRLTEASLEKFLGGLILHYSDVCKTTDKGIECTQGPQLLAAPVDPEDPHFAIPDSLRALTRPTIEGKTTTGPQSLLHRIKKGQEEESSALELFLENEERLGRGLLSLKAIRGFEQTVQWLSLIQLGGASSGTESKSTLNPYLLCQTLWTRARELQAGSEAFNEKVEKWRDGGDKLGAVLLSLLQTQPKWGLPDAYAPLTSVCMQTAGFMHSIVEEYDERDSTFKAIGRTIMRVGMALAKRLIGKRHLHALRPQTWVELEASMQPASGVSVAQYRGALQVIVNLAKEFRKKFLNSNVLAPVFLKQLTSLLLGMWAQRFRKTFSFEDTQISTARKAFLLAALLDNKGHVGFAVNLVLEATEKLPSAKVLELGRVSFLGNYGYQIGGAAVALSKRGRVKLTYDGLEELFVEVGMTADDPLDVIRTAIDLSNTLLALQESQKGVKVINDVAIMQTEAAIRYHCAGIERHLRLAATKDLVKETPELYQDYLNVLFTTTYFARISQAQNKFARQLSRRPAQLQLSCPFMSSYIEPGKRQERQAAIALQAIGAQGPRSQIWHKITKSKLAFVPFFAPIAAAVWFNEKLASISSKRRFAKLGVESAPPLPREFKRGLYTQAASYFETAELRQVLDGEQLLPVTEASRALVVNAGSVMMTYSTLKQLGYHGGISIRPRTSSSTGGSQTR